MAKITQLVKGIYCNAACPMCLSLRNQYGHPPVEAHVRNIEFHDYHTHLKTAYATAIDKGSHELVITSYGDPLDKRNLPQELFNEIFFAREAGFERVTLITNGFNLDVDLLDSLYAAGLTHLTLSLHATTQAGYAEYMGVNHSLEDVLMMGCYADHIGIVVRHNYVWNSTLTLLDVMEQSLDYGAKQITLIEAVPCNDYAKHIHVPLPDVPEDAELLVRHAWGMSIYRFMGVTVAWCVFGQDDPDFDQQEKNFYINPLNDGRVLFREGAYFDLESDS